jgi:DNA-binding transcriptional regulator YdaS (Cro superfamily)
MKQQQRNPVLQMVRKQRGTASRIAKACGVNRETVWMWEARGEIPAKHVLAVETLLEIPRHRIRPDLYPPPVRNGEKQLHHIFAIRDLLLIYDSELDELRGAVRELRDATQLTPLPPPLWVHFRDGCKYGGFGKMKAYELIDAGKIDARKMGKRTMLNLESIDRYHASLPKKRR